MDAFKPERGDAAAELAPFRPTAAAAAVAAPAGRVAEASALGKCVPPAGRCSACTRARDSCVPGSDAGIGTRGTRGSGCSAALGCDTVVPLSSVYDGAPAPVNDGARCEAAEAAAADAGAAPEEAVRAAAASSAAALKPLERAPGRTAAGLRRPSSVMAPGENVAGLNGRAAGCGSDCAAWPALAAADVAAAAEESCPAGDRALKRVSSEGVL